MSLVSITNNQENIPYIKKTALREYLIYKWFGGQPWLCPLLGVKVEDTIKISLVRGQPLTSFDVFDNFMSIVLSGIFTLYDSGFLYGDVKLENIIYIEGRYYMIDFDSVFSINEMPAHTQTFSRYDDPERDVSWALSFFVYRWFNFDLQGEYDHKESVIFTHNFYKTKCFTERVPEKWINFLKLSYDGVTFNELRANLPISINKMIPVSVPLTISQFEHNELFLESLSDFNNARIVSPEEEELYFAFSNTLKSLSEDNIIVSIVAMWRATAFNSPMSLSNGLYHTCYFESNKELFEVAYKALQFF